MPDTTVLVVGDVMLDVVVRATTAVLNDDNHAQVMLTLGGQGCNVAAWLTHLGANAILAAPRQNDWAGQMIDRRLTTTGVQLWGPAQPGQTGIVVALTSDGRRTLYSQAGERDWPAILRGLMHDLPQADVLHLSGYVLLRAEDPEDIHALIRRARNAGMRISFDPSTATLFGPYGRMHGVTVATHVRRMAPDVIFATEDEWHLLGVNPNDPAPLAPEMIIKRGARGATFISRGAREDRETPPCTVVDATGAGDALTAGYLVGGIDMAMMTAAACLTIPGAQPGSGD